MSTRFKNETDRDLVLFGQVGTPGAYNLEAGGTVEILDEITEETDDAYIVGTGEDARSWPKTVWSVTKSDALRQLRETERRQSDTTTDEE